MIRSIVLIASAIQIANPHVSDATARAHAAVLQREAKEHDFDPFTGVAMGKHETHWRPATVGGAGGKCYGLFQVCVQWAVTSCQGDGFTSDAPERASCSPEGPSCHPTSGVRHRTMARLLPSRHGAPGPFSSLARRLPGLRSPLRHDLRPAAHQKGLEGCANPAWDTRRDGLQETSPERNWFPIAPDTVHSVHVR